MSLIRSRIDNFEPHLGNDPADMLITIAAENSFDAEPDLHRVQASTLVLGGTADPFYSEDLFRRTATGIPDGRAVIFQGKGHLEVVSQVIACRSHTGVILWMMLRWHAEADIFPAATAGQRRLVGLGRAVDSAASGGG